MQTDTRPSPGFRQAGSLAWEATACASLTFFALLMEWLFFFTIPSFASSLGAAGSLRVWLNASLGICCVTVPAGVFFCRLGRLAGARLHGGAGTWLAAAPPALLAVCMTMLMADNFFYSMFKIAIVRTRGFQPYLCLCGLLGVFGLYSRNLAKGARSASGLFNLKVTRWTVGLLVAGAAGSSAASLWESRNWVVSLSPYTAKAGQKSPNIILFASDGVDAEHTSAYGYARKTTPSLDRLIPDSWFAENAFSNSGKSIGSITSLLTGKLATTNGVWFSSHGLRGPAAFEHLPGILRKLGYTTAQIGMKPWIDAEQVNMRLAFDFAGPSRQSNWVDRLMPISVSAAFANETFFATQVIERVSSRWMHLLGVKPMVDHYEAITGQRSLPALLNDAERIRLAKEYVKTLPQPFFMHVHLMGTHCCIYQGGERTFLREDMAGEAADIARYDDAIYQSDKYFGELVETLAGAGLSDQTLIVYSSDHGRLWSALTRVPLILRFPKKEITGPLSGNAELVDVMPTVLDYLQQPIPQWVEGHSLMSARPGAAQAPIFALSEFKEQGVPAAPLNIPGVRPDVSGLALIVCDQWFNWITVDASIQRGRVSNYRGGCPPNRFLSNADAAELLRQHLYTRGMLGKADHGSITPF